MDELNFKNTLLPSTFSINCRGKLLQMNRPLTMGVLNITDDSFFAGSRHSGRESLIEKATQMIGEGAAILDIGGQSTRPLARRLTAKEEAAKVLPAIESILELFPGAILSIDTFYAEVAEKAIKKGVAIVNDISAGALDPGMIPVVAGLQVPYIAMHMQGTPETMQTDPFYDDVVREVLDFFILKIAECRNAGIADIIVDPGFGFGKTLHHNYTLLKHLRDFSMLGCPLMTGVSRKSMICKLLETGPENALNGTTALHMLALEQGAHILRTHDVKPAMEAIRLWNFYNQQS